MSRLCFFDGRPLPSKRGLDGARTGSGDKSSYRACASGAGPRRVPHAAMRTTLMSRSLGKVSTCPGATVRAGLLTGVPSTRTFPALTTPAARLRDLKKRACHSHLSNRIVSGASLNPFSARQGQPRRDCRDRSFSRPLVWPNSVSGPAHLLPLACLFAAADPDHDARCWLVRPM